MQDSVTINGVNYSSRGGLSLDGFKPRPATAAARPAATPVKKSVATAKRQHQPANHLTAHRMQPSKVLNRRAARQATAVKKSLIKSSYELKMPLAKKTPTSLVKLSSARVDSGRNTRARAATRSASISHFNSPKSGPSSSAYHPVVSSAAHPGKPAFTKAGGTFDIVPRKHPAALSPATAGPAIPTSQFGKLVEKSETKRQHRYLEYTPAKDRRGWAGLKIGQRRAVSFAAIAVAIILLAGFIFLQEKTNIELKLADAKSGINATLPSYRPSGYAVSGFSYRTGLVAINYVSSADGHHFQLTQESSALDNQGLKAELTDVPHLATLNAAGETIYASNSTPSSSAAWVSGGILYKLSGNASLSNDQIIKLASST